jgi:hypothetical protein
MHAIENDKMFQSRLILMINFFRLNDLIDLEDDVLVLLLNYHQMNFAFDEVQVEYRPHLK